MVKYFAKSLKIRVASSLQKGKSRNVNSRKNLRGNLNSGLLNLKISSKNLNFTQTPANIETTF
jgi:hypothetical protein